MVLEISTCCDEAIRSSSFCISDQSVHRSFCKCDVALDTFQWNVITTFLVSCMMEDATGMQHGGLCSAPNGTSANCGLAVLGMGAVTRDERCAGCDAVCADAKERVQYLELEVQKTREKCLPGNTG